MRTNDIRKFINIKLKETGLKPYYFEAPKESTFPYIVYNLESNYLENNALYDLEVNIWDDGKDIARLEDIADMVEDLLDEQMNLGKSGLLMFDKMSRGKVDDPNKELKRIMIKFDMKYFK